MKVRYKETGTEAHASRFNITALAEVLTGDDSVFIKDLDVFLDSKGEWKDMNAAFRDRDLITNNTNTDFFEPKNEEDRARGYADW